MIHITNDFKIIEDFGFYPNLSEIDNYTGCTPLCVYGNIILMSDGKLYVVNYLTGYKLLEIIFESKENYAIGPDDFSHQYAKINSKYYNFYTLTHKYEYMNIPIVAKSPDYIYRSGLIYYYVNADNKLFAHHIYVGRDTWLDNNVDMLFFSKNTNNFNNHDIIYKKNDSIIYIKYNGWTIGEKYVINYDGSPIKKKMNKFLLDYDNRMYKFITDSDNKYILKKILDDVIDFNYDDDNRDNNNKLRIIDSEYKMYSVNNYDYEIKYITDDGYFKKERNNIKSANNSYKSMC